MFIHWIICTKDMAIRRHISDCPSSWNLVANISGLLVQTHFAFDPPILQPTTFRNVGGFQIEERRTIKMAKVSTESMAQRNKYCFMWLLVAWSNRI